jgi:hypothetical protein
MLQRLQIRIACTNWGVLPAPLWFLIASPLLAFAGIGSRWFTWPKGCSKSPLRATFWCVNFSHRY